MLGPLLIMTATNHVKMAIMVGQCIVDVQVVSFGHLLHSWSLFTVSKSVKSRILDDVEKLGSDRGCIVVEGVEGITHEPRLILIEVEVLGFE